MMKETLLILAAAAALSTACSSEKKPAAEKPSGERQIENAWARPAASGGMSAAYFTIQNPRTKNDTLLAVGSDVANTVEIHETYQMENGVMGMRAADTAVIPAEGRAELKPGGMHVMLIQLTRGLAEGDTFELELIFAGRDTVTLDIPVKMNR